MNTPFLPLDDIRTLFSNAMSAMYRAEVPQYGTLLALVADVNQEVLRADPALEQQLRARGEMERLSLEYHGAVRLGTAQELATMRRLFAVLGMFPVGYYDLSVAGVPVHSTAFRPIDEAALRRNPFRVFTSLLRLDLLDDAALRDEAAAILAARQIFTPEALRLIEQHERDGGLGEADAALFVAEALSTFRWHEQATVSAATYQRLHQAHRLVADVVSFKGPHINHLTPRTLDIDAAQREMPLRAIAPKAVIEGPPRRACPVLLRQTSFKALQESVAFADPAGAASANSDPVRGLHSARFGEIEQRGVALTPKGRRMYDTLLDAARDQVPPQLAEQDPAAYASALAACFAPLPDDWQALRDAGLAFFRYRAVASAPAAAAEATTLQQLLELGLLAFDPIIYEDFLPVSAAGIFQSNLGGDSAAQYAPSANRAMFERDLGCAALDELTLYAETESASLRIALKQLGLADAAIDRCLATHFAGR